MVGKRTLGDKAFEFVNILFVLFAVLITLYPMLYVLFASLSSPKAFMAHGGFLWHPVGDVTLTGYRLTLRNPNILIGFKNTLFYVVVGTSINVALTALGAFVLTRRHFLLRRAGSILVVVTMFFSGGIIPLFFVVRELGLYDSPWAVILPGAISAYNMIIMQSFFRSIPESLEESASLDGANDLQVFIRIILPLSKPVIAVMVLYYGVGHWNSYFNAMIYLRDRSMYPLQLFLREILLRDTVESLASTNVEMAEESLFRDLIKYCSIIVSTVPVLCIYPFLQRYFVKGVMVGAIKG